MLIVCTQDETIRNAATDPEKGGPAWAPVILLPEGPRATAQEQFEQSLAELAEDDALCLSAHGNDQALGDAHGGWTWSTANIAALMVANITTDWGGPVLIHACARTVANFSAGLAVAIEQHRCFDELWCYGYNRPVPSDGDYPPPAGLGDRLDLQGTQVRY